jgi:hypothetical protein
MKRWFSITQLPASNRRMMPSAVRASAAIKDVPGGAGANCLIFQVLGL